MIYAWKQYLQYRISYSWYHYVFLSVNTLIICMKVLNFLEKTFLFLLPREEKILTFWDARPCIYFPSLSLAWYLSSCLLFLIPSPSRMMFPEDTGREQKIVKTHDLLKIGVPLSSALAPMPPSAYDTSLSWTLAAGIVPDCLLCRQIREFDRLAWGTREIRKISS